MYKQNFVTYQFDTGFGTGFKTGRDYLYLDVLYHIFVCADDHVPLSYGQRSVYTYCRGALVSYTRMIRN